MTNKLTKNTHRHIEWMKKLIIDKISNKNYELLGEY